MIDSVFRLLSRPVWIVTSADGERRGGLAANFVMRTSIDPQTPAMFAGIAVNHFTRELIDASQAFGLHLITADQAELVWRFGLGSGRDRDKLAGLSWHREQTGSPILDDALAWLDCRVFDRHDGGDRIYYWADMVAGAALRDGQPLTDEALLRAASPAHLAQLRAEMQADIAVQAPLYARFRAALKARGQ